MIKYNEGTSNSLDIGFVVLAGGKSFRFGHNKILEIIGNRTLIDHVLIRIRSFKNPIIIVTAEDYKLPQFSYSNVKIVTDIHDDKGPLGGIYTGLSYSDSFYNFVTACDMPFLNIDLLAYMLQRSVDFDLTIPRVGKLTEPLHAVYTRNCLVPIRNLLETNRLQVNSLLDLVTVRYVEIDEINRFDPKHLSFFNVNTQAELDSARQYVNQMATYDRKKGTLV